ncbi:TPA: hypothetical protein N0F65_007960, partial [Lagenidium giganteum]
ITSTSDRVITQLRARLHHVRAKTSNATQRARLVAAIAVPKITYVARHAWPTARVVRKLQRFVNRFVWTGSLSLNAARTKCGDGNQPSNTLDGRLSL